MMNDTKIDQDRIDRLKKYHEQEDQQAEERKQEEPLRFYTIGYGSLNSIQDIKDIGLVVFEGRLQGQLGAAGQIVKCSLQHSIVIQPVV